jgi:predicted metalloprotease
VRWRRGGGRSSDVIDARGSGMRPRGGLSMGRGVTIPGGLGVTGVIIFLLIQVLSGGGGASSDSFGVDDPFGQGTRAPAADGHGIPAKQDPERDLKEFSVYVFSNTLDTWARIFKQQGNGFQRAKVVLYRDAVSTGCGDASSAVGPFYCPADERVYLDLSFYGDMESELGAPGDFAWAYVIAHEVGHHVQEQLGTSAEVDRARREHPDEANALSVRLELQADCYAGVWAHTVFEAGDLEKGDVREAIRASGAVGDDRLQRRASGQVDPDTFTHGTSEQRLVQPRPHERRARRLRHLLRERALGRPVGRGA